MDEEIITNTEETNVEVPPVEETKVEETKVLPVLTEEQQAAVNLYNALKNPETSGQVLKQLADISGLDLTTRKAQVELKKTIAETIKEELGEDNSLLAEKLGPTLERVISNAVEERLKPVNETLANQQQEEFAQVIEETLETLNTESKGLSKKLESDMMKLMDEISPGPKTKPDVYLRHIYKLAKSQYDEAEIIKAQNTKREANKTALGVHTGVNADRIKSGSKLPSIREAVEAAMRGQTLE